MEARVALSDLVLHETHIRSLGLQPLWERPPRSTLDMLKKEAIVNTMYGKYAAVERGQPDGVKVVDPFGVSIGIVMVAWSSRFCGVSRHFEVHPQQ